jgi:hypothetical protein
MLNYLTNKLLDEMKQQINNNKISFQKEYDCVWINSAGIDLTKARMYDSMKNKATILLDSPYFKNNINIKENVNMKEQLEKFLTENEIEVDDNGNFEMYVVVDTDDKDHEVGSILCGNITEAYTKNRAYEDLKGNNEKTPFQFIMDFGYSKSYNFTSNISLKKKTTIKEDLLTLEDKMFKVLVNKENVIKVYDDKIDINKYKVLSEVKLLPKLKFKIASIDKNNISVVLYNNLTEKSKTIVIDIPSQFITLEDIKVLINSYLEKDEKQVYLMNSIIETGAEL